LNNFLKDKLPPVIILNKGINLNRGQSIILTRKEIDVKDEDTPLNNLNFHVNNKPKLGHLENLKQPGILFSLILNNYKNY
jgi:hypothetical protein